LHGNSYGPGKKATIKRNDELRPLRINQQNPFALNPHPLKHGRDRPRSGVDFVEGKCTSFFLPID
jgi:hypothetical protein